MDFGTVRKKLDEGLYSNLEQFEVGFVIVGLHLGFILFCFGQHVLVMAVKMVVVLLIVRINSFKFFFFLTWWWMPLKPLHFLSGCWPSPASCFWLT